MTHRKEQVNEVLNPGCTRVTPKLNIDQLDSDLTNNLECDKELSMASLASRANKIYDVKITTYPEGTTKVITGKELQESCYRVNEHIFPFKRLY